MIRRNKLKKKKFLPYKNLGSLYAESIFGLPSVHRTVVLGEGPTLDIYAKDPETDETDKIGTVDKDYFNQKVKPAVRRGSVESVEIRKEIKKRLITAKGFSEPNLEIYQNFIEVTGIVINDENTDKFKNILLDNINSGKSFSIGSLIHECFKGELSTIEQVLPAVMLTGPSTAVFGRAGEGELALSFFAGGQKPSKGDIQVGDILIELKGPNARLYKTNRIGKIPTAAISNIVSSPANERIDRIVNFIIKFAGDTDTLRSLYSEIKDIVESNIDVITNEINSIYNKYQNEQFIGVSNRFILFKTMGSAQLVAYKRSFGFNSMLVFNKTTPLYPCRGIGEQEFNVRSILEIKNITINFKDDGFGYFIYYTG